MSEASKWDKLVVGEMPCPICSKRTAVKVNKKGHLYAYCLHPADGGCGGGSTSRSDSSDGHIAARVTTWRHEEAKKHFLAMTPESGEEDEPDEEAEATNPSELSSPEKESAAPKPTPRSAPSRKPQPTRTAKPAQTTPQKKSFWDREIL